jgi:hypothetical protein
MKIDVFWISSTISHHSTCLYENEGIKLILGVFPLTLKLNIYQLAQAIHMSSLANKAILAFVCMGQKRLYFSTTTPL